MKGPFSLVVFLISSFFSIFSFADVDVSQIVIRPGETQVIVLESAAFPLDSAPNLKVNRQALDRLISPELVSLNVEGDGTLGDHGVIVKIIISIDPKAPALTDVPLSLETETYDTSFEIFKALLTIKGS